MMLFKKNLVTNHTFDNVVTPTLYPASLTAIASSTSLACDILTQNAGDDSTGNTSLYHGGLLKRYDVRPKSS